MYRIIMCLLLIIADCSISVAQSSVLVKGSVTSTQDYCGGAAPSPEILKELASEKPLANKVIYIRIYSKNKKALNFKQVKTNAEGKFELKLQVGQTYYFVEEWKAKPFRLPENTQNTTWDIACLKKRHSTPDYILKVSRSAMPEIHINYHIPCFYAPYCGTYSGPMPP